MQSYSKTMLGPGSCKRAAARPQSLGHPGVSVQQVDQLSGFVYRSHPGIWVPRLNRAHLRNDPLILVDSYRGGAPSVALVQKLYEYVIGNQVEFSFLMTSEGSTTHRCRTNNTYLPDLGSLLPHNFDRSFNNLGIIDASGPAPQTDHHSGLWASNSARSCLLAAAQIPALVNQPRP